MNKIETGGPAFPTKRLLERDVDGMHLRDYFAAKALQGILSDVPATLYGPDFEKNIAEISYIIADAMLEARK